MSRFLLIGPPGSGKGTQAEKLAAVYKIPAISTGNIFRAHIKDETELGLQVKSMIAEGKYVPDSLTNELVRDRLAQADAEAGFLLDGYPRTQNQLAELDEILGSQHRILDAVILLAADTDELVRRVVQRGQEQGRSDDTEEIIRLRQDLYLEETQPIIEVYSARDLVVEIDGLGSIEEITERILDALASRGLSPAN